jgi:hypothetical protein
MQRQNSKELFDLISRSGNEEYHQRISKDFMLQEACRLRHEKELRTLEKLSKKVNKWMAEKK